MANPFEPIENRLLLIEDQLSSLFLLLKSSQVNNQEDSIGACEAAKILQLALPTLYVKTSQKLVPHRKPGKHLIFSRNELQAYLKNKKVKTHAEELEESENLILKAAKRPKLEVA